MTGLSPKAAGGRPKRETLWELAIQGNYRPQQVAEAPVSVRRPAPPPTSHREGEAFGGFGPTVEIDALLQERQRLNRVYHDSWFRDRIKAQRLELRRPPSHAVECLSLSRKLWQSAQDEEVNETLRARDILAGRMELEEESLAIENELNTQIAKIDRERLNQREIARTEVRRWSVEEQAINSARVTVTAKQLRELETELRLTKDRIRDQSAAQRAMASSTQHSKGSQRWANGSTKGGGGKPFGKATQTAPGAGGCFRSAGGASWEEDRLRPQVPGAHLSPRQTYFRFGATGKDPWLSKDAQPDLHPPRKLIQAPAAAARKQTEERLGSP